MVEDPGLIADSERDLLAQAGAWLECRSGNQLTRSSLATIAAEQGVDFATALLYHQLRQSDRHGPFIRQVDELLSRPPQPLRKIDALLAVAPGAFYRELPGTGADGRLLGQRVAALGCRTTIIPTNSLGSAAENGRVICDWLTDHSHERILLASLSKGGADVKAALAQPNAPTAFLPVTAWLNLSGMTDGSPSVSWLRQHKLVAALYRSLCWWKGIDFAIGRQLEWGPGSVLDFPLLLPPEIQLISIVGFPLRQHFTSAVLRRFHHRVAALGPNDGMILLADVCALPGLVYPVWGADHNLRPAWDIRRLVTALACYFAERLDLWARPAEDAPCPTGC
jgi:hypothetical protein